MMTDDQPSLLISVAFVLMDSLLFVSAWIVVVITPWWLVKIAAIAVAVLTVVMLLALRRPAVDRRRS
jgi:hypothetical protein